MANMDAIGREGLVQIVANGGGVKVSSVLGREALVQIAANAGSSGGQLIVTNAAILGRDALVQIAANGPGRVIFE